MKDVERLLQYEKDRKDKCEGGCCWHASMRYQAMHEGQGVEYCCQCHDRRIVNIAHDPQWGGNYVSPRPL